MHSSYLLASAALLAACIGLPPEPVPEPDHAQQGVVVVDVDGTLTPRDSAFLEARDGAAQVLAVYRRKGYTVVYLSARVPLLQPGLPHWLQQNGFPKGPLHVAQSASERARPDQFKAEVLRSYVVRGWRLAYAYGDSSTDFAAYAAAGLRAEQVFAIRRHGDADCQPGVYAQCLDGWVGHLFAIERSEPKAR